MAVMSFMDDPLTMLQLFSLLLMLLGGLSLTFAVQTSFILKLGHTQIKNSNHKIKTNVPFYILRKYNIFTIFQDIPCLFTLIKFTFFPSHNPLFFATVCSYIMMIFAFVAHLGVLIVLK